MTVHGAWLPLLLAAALAGCAQPEGPLDAHPLGEGGLASARLSGTGTLAIAASRRDGVQLWRVGEPERRFDWNHRSDSHTELVAAAFSPDERLAVTADLLTIALWDVASGRSEVAWTSPGPITDIALGPDQRVFMALDDGSAVWFDMRSGELLQTFSHKGRITDVDLSHDGLSAATGSADRTAVVWDCRSGDALLTVRGQSTLQRVALSPDGRTLLTAVQAGPVELWDVPTGRRRTTLYPRNPGILSARFSADGSELLVGTVNRRIDLIDVISTRRTERWELPTLNQKRTESAAAIDVAFAADGRLLAIASNGLQVALDRTHGAPAAIAGGD